jgi:hypothetical protein
MRNQTRNRGAFCLCSGRVSTKIRNSWKDACLGMKSAREEKSGHLAIGGINR